LRPHISSFALVSQDRRAYGTETEFGQLEVRGNLTPEQQDRPSSPEVEGTEHLATTCPFLTGEDRHTVVLAELAVLLAVFVAVFMAVFVADLLASDAG
jgi:hypothetical protein